ncbi:MAG: ABC-F family ATP-binding cassette domain-containing protein [Lachnospiraceae bacterium]|nr:ABC-F family ATP-binding cassette domain-containing protein [Lachnospiraceae bacterium]
MLLQCSKISKTFISEPVLSNCSFHVEDKEKVAIIGANGAGKSTLLKIITGQLPPTDGMVTLSKGKTMGYLAQQEAVSSENSIYDELLTVKKDLMDIWDNLRSMEESMKTLTGDALDAIMHRYSDLNHTFEIQNGYAMISEVTGILKGLGFKEEDFKKPIKTLSGGQKTRVALGKLLLQKPDLIMLDEPTNHLDIDSITWLESYLSNYDGAVIIVAHDRYFLDKIVTKVVEIERTNSMVYSGNYSDFAMKKQMLREAAMKQYLNQQQEIKHQEEVIRKLKSYNREKSIKRAESREKMLKKIDVVEKPTEINDSMHIEITPSIESGNDVLTVKNLEKSFGSTLLFKGLDFEIKRGERVALIGKNGTGKTTILKIINEMLTSEQGSVRLGAKVHIGYYDQDHQVLHADKTLFEEISDAYPDLTNTKIRNTLAAFLFTGDDVYKRIRDLSGGERGRMSLAKLMLSNANFLILDEPTNHLDMVSKEILEQALVGYTGTILFVSHDRYFINKTSTRILELTGQTLINYIGNYDYYLEKHDLLSASITESASTAQVTVESEVKQDWKTEKAQKAEQRKRENQIQKIEERIEELELRSSQIDEEMALPENATNVAKCVVFSKEKELIDEELMNLMEEWESLQE